MNFKNCDTSNLNKHICKREAQHSENKNYINCEVSILANKIESILNDLEIKE